MWPWTLTPTMTLTLDFQVKFWKACISGTGGPIDMEWKRRESLGCWTLYVTLNFDFSSQILKKPYLRNWRVCWPGMKGMWVDKMLDPLCDLELWLHPWPQHWIFSSDQTALRTLLSVCLSVCHTFLIMFVSSYHPEIFRNYYHWQTWSPYKRSKVKVTEVKANFASIWAFQDHNSSFKFTDGYEMMHIAWSSIGDLPYCFSRLSVKFQGHRGQKIADFDPNWVFPAVSPVWIHQWL